MWARLGLAVGYMVTGCGAVSPTVLIWNDAGKPTEIGMNATELCHGRSHQHKDCSILLDVPKSCASEKSTCPVAFFLHGEGATDSGKEFARGDRAVSSALHSINWIGVYPTGDGEWNGDVATGNNDVEFMVTIVDFIASLGAFDAWQPKMGEPPDGTPGLYFYGVGTGAALVQKLAANADAILPIKGIWADGAQLLQSPLQSGPGSMNFNRPGESHKSAAVAQMASHGTNDAVFPYQGGGPKTQHNCTICKLMSELESNKAWAIHNKCNITAPPSTTTVNATYLGSTKSAMLTKTTATMHTFQCALLSTPCCIHVFLKICNGARITSPERWPVPVSPWGGCAEVALPISRYASGRSKMPRTMQQLRFKPRHCLRS